MPPYVHFRAGYIGYWWCLLYIVAILIYARPTRNQAYGPLNKVLIGFSRYTASRIVIYRMRYHMYVEAITRYTRNAKDTWNRNLALEAEWVGRVCTSIDRPNQIKAGHTLYSIWKRKYKNHPYTDPGIYSANALYIIDRLSNISIYHWPGQQ
mgnify:FL=1